MSLEHLEHMPAYGEDDELDKDAMTMRALYETQLLSSVSLASSAAPPGVGGRCVGGYGHNTLYAVASPGAVALPLPTYSRDTKRASLGARLSRPTTYFNSWAEGKAGWGDSKGEVYSPARPRLKRDSWGYGRL